LFSNHQKGSIGQKVILLSLKRCEMRDMDLGKFN
jgi:hypothetical protein